MLWLNAVGAAVERIEAFLRDERLPYLRTTLVPLEQLASLLVTPDAHLITLVRRLRWLRAPIESPRLHRFEQADLVHRE